MIFDTDIFIWVQRGHKKAASLIDKASDRCISVQTYMEFLQGAQNKLQLQMNKDFLRDMGFFTLPLNEAIGHRAAIYMEEFSLSHGMRTGDAIIAATACEAALPLVTSNSKHYKHIRDLQIVTFKP